MTSLTQRINRLETALGHDRANVQDLADVTVGDTRYTTAALLAMYTSCNFPDEWPEKTFADVKSYCERARAYLDGKSGALFYLDWLQGDPACPIEYHTDEAGVESLQLTWPDSTPEY